ncbi:MFS transporter [Gemella sp. GL1.1]|nr:MFS transporter [Gemella sp. GL1.1]MBF0746716.1 MFS transporter [Gemella sp. 19428wG2_WT2a]NYS28059.1 MFS transporter [Gemella sp. GL1]TFU60103.1 MFS transporter [Gemella sp. WT2a]
MFTMLILAYIIFAINWVAGSNLSKQITEYYFNGQSVSASTSELVNYTITGARIVANLLAVLILAKLNPKNASLFALVLLSFSFLAVFSSNYWIYTGARMIMALGGSMVMVFINVYVAKFISKEYKTIAGAIITAAYNAGAALVAILFLVFNDLLKANWQNTMLIFSSFSLIIVLIWFFFADDFNPLPKTETNKNYFYQKLLLESRLIAHVEEEKEYTYSDALKEKFVYIFSLGFGGFLFLYVMSLVSLPNQVAANSTIGFKSAFMILTVTMGGILATILDLFLLKLVVNKKKFLLTNGFMMIASMLIGLYLSNIWLIGSYLALFLSGFFMYLVYPVYLNYPYDLPATTPKQLVMIFGIVWAFGYAIHTLFNIIWSIVLQNYGYVASLIFYILASSIYLIFAYMLPRFDKK